MSRRSSRLSTTGRSHQSWGALAEDRADAGDVPDAVSPGDEAADLAAAAGRLEDAAEDFEGGRLAGAVRADEAEELSFG